MTKEIERKFLIKVMPDLTNLTPLCYERYFIFRSEEVNIRIQKKGSNYELERKEKKSNLSHDKQKITITEEEFNALKKYTEKPILRDSYLISKNPEISVKIYYGKHEGLQRVEVEFKSVGEAKKFKPLDWFGEEITNTPLGKDSNLINI
ncbi:hypothetical protein ISS03_03955 [Patescibacteria group bacterium]|nr:hypothetical protein [Patescibacteria group bacterium]